MPNEGKPVALFLYGAFRLYGGGLSKAWFQRLQAMHDAGWEVRIALLTYGRYRKKMLARALGGSIPDGIQIYKFWTSPMSKSAIAIAWVRHMSYYAAMRLMRKPLPRNIITPLGNGMQHELKYDTYGRLLSEIEREIETNVVKTRVWFDTGRNPIIREWCAPGEEIMTMFQRYSDAEPQTMVAARTEWLTELDLPAGTVVFSDSPITYPVVAQLPEKLGKVFVLHLNHLKRGESALGILTPRMETGLEPFADRPDAVVCATPDQGEDLKERYGEHFPVVAIRPVVKKIETPSDAVRDRHKIVAVGRLVDVKRLDHVFRALPAVLNVIPDAHMDIWGSGSDQERLEGVLAELGLQDAVTFCGYTGNPEMIFRTAGCSVLTSRRESFGLAVTESLLQGCPVVSYDVKYGPRTVIRDGVNGYIVPDNDVDALSKRIIDVLSNPELQDSMGVEGLKVAELVDRAHFTKAWLQLADDVRQKALARATK